MTQVRNLFFLFSITVFAFAETVLTIFNYNPFGANRSVFINFYVSLFFTISGLAAITLYYLRVKYSKNSAGDFFWTTVRTSVFAGIALTTLLILQGFRILDWLIGISIVVVTILLELFFRTKKEKVA